MGEENHAELMRVVKHPTVVRAMLEDYRAGLTIDRFDEQADERAGRKLLMPTRILWSTRDDLEDLYGDPLAIWSRWATDVSAESIDSSHHVAE